MGHPLESGGTLHRRQVNSQLPGGGNHSDRRSGVEGGQHPEEAARVLLQAVIDLDVVAVTRPVQFKVSEPQDDLQRRKDAGFTLGDQGEAGRRPISCSEDKAPDIDLDQRVGEAPEPKVTWEPLAEDPRGQRPPRNFPCIRLESDRAVSRGVGGLRPLLASQRSVQQTGPGWPEELQLPRSPAKILLWEELWETGETFKP
ncbi:hypothetical protein EYF80_053083 [Liparis tanakae]|uniref:Uncharacterized protein n=1 Tax=Liparis tanakae TaxID=230148 RepID=A0A4Z2F659_9TELE|nr:hypothetical protein EYF80_053083 [Liparis tanakae]